MNGESKKTIALSAVALSVGVALGAVFGNDKSRKYLVDKGKSAFNSYRQK